METKPCVFCDKQLRCATDSWETMQPYGGGEVQFVFCYGSTKFDLSFETTAFNGVICDDCAEKIVPKMKRIS